MAAGEDRLADGRRDADTAEAVRGHAAEVLDPFADVPVVAVIVHGNGLGERITLRRNDRLDEVGGIVGEVHVIDRTVLLIVVQDIRNRLDEREFIDTLDIETVIGRVLDRAAGKRRDEHGGSGENEILFHKCRFYPAKITIF